MKKVLFILSFSFILTGCFDDPKQESTVQQSNISEEKKNADNQNLNKIIAETDSPKKSNETPKEELSEPKDSKPGSLIKVDNNTESKESDSTDNSKQIENKTKATIQKERNVSPNLADSQKVNNGSKNLEVKKLNKESYQQDENTSGLSAEEARIGYQNTLTDTEIIYLKNQCRYPFMSEQEIIEYNCSVKKVIQK